MLFPSLLRRFFLKITDVFLPLASTELYLFFFFWLLLGVEVWSAPMLTSLPWSRAAGSLQPKPIISRIEP